MALLQTPSFLTLAFLIMLTTGSVLDIWAH